MRIELRKNDILGIGLVAGMVYLGYKVFKASTENRKRLTEYRDEKLKGRDLNKEISDATINHSALSISDRSEAKRILMNMKSHVLAAQTVESFDTKLAEFDAFLDVLLVSPADVAEAEIAYEKSKLDSAIREAELEKQLQFEKRNTQNISDAIRSLNKLDSSIFEIKVQ